MCWFLPYLSGTRHRHTYALPLQLPSHAHPTYPSRLSQSPGLSSLSYRFPLAVYFTHGSVYVSMILSPFVPSSPSPSPPCPYVFLGKITVPQLNCINTLAKTWLTGPQSKSLCLGFPSVSLTSVYSFMLVPKCLDYYNFVVSFEIGNCESFNCVPFQERFGYSGFLAFWYFRITLSISVKQSTGILRGIELNLQIIFGSITS